MHGHQIREQIGFCYWVESSVEAENSLGNVAVSVPIESKELDADCGQRVQATQFQRRVTGKCWRHQYERRH